MSIQSTSEPYPLKKMTHGEKAGVILLITALVLGIIIRLLFVLSNDFPLNDGGLFYIMARELQTNQFMIPAVTSYNQSGLSFAYPPLGFYLAGGLNSLFGFSFLEIMRWLPLVFNILCIPVFYHFAKLLFRDSVRAGIAVLFFALLKPGYEWLIMGGGLTRSPAMLFSLLAMDRYLVLIESDDKRVRRIVTVSILVALTFLSHLEIGWFTTYSLALLWFFRGRNKQNFGSSVMIAFGTFVLTSPYWIQVIRNQNMQPFGEVLTSGGYDPRIILYKLIYFFNFTEEMIFPVMGAIALTGVIISLGKREYLLPCWLVLNIFLDARSVNRSDVIPAALLISVGIVDGIYVLVRKFSRGLADEKKSDSGEGIIFTRTGILIIYILCIQAILSVFLTRFMEQDLAHVLTQGDRKAMEWVRQNTPVKANFITMPSSVWWGTDAVGEWFPALAERKDEITVQGSEWGQGYREKITNFQELNTLIGSGIFSISELRNIYPDVEYIYLPLTNFKNSAEGNLIREALKGYPVVYQNPDVIVYSLKSN